MGSRADRPVDLRAQPARSAGFIIPAVACPSTGFCIAVDDVGKVLSSTNPAGGGQAWTAAALRGSTDPFRGIDCPTRRVCVAIRDRELVTILNQ